MSHLLVTYDSWRKRRPELQALHQVAMIAKAETLEDEIVTMHDDLTDANATTARVKLRDSKAENRKWWLKVTNPQKYSDRAILGVQTLGLPDTTDPVAPQTTVLRVRVVRIR